MNPLRHVRRHAGKARAALRIRQQVRRNRSTMHRQRQADAAFFAPELAALLGRDDAWLRTTAREYAACPAAWQHLSGLRSPSRATDGMAKSLDLAEGFAVWALVKHLRPRVVVELGVQYGISARLWKEALGAYVPGHTLILCDLEDHRRLIGDHDADFYQTDARLALPKIMAQQQVDLLHNDAHPYDLIRWSVEEAMAHKVRCLTFHDVGRGPRGIFRPESSALSRAQKVEAREDWANYGAWERHVMAELLAPELLHQDHAIANGWRVQIFDSLFGFGAALRSEDTQAPR